LGFVCSALAAVAVVEGDYRRFYAWLVVAFLIDAADGSLARIFRAKKYAARVDGRKLDDIVDYLNYTFLPLLLLLLSGWLPPPAWLWASVALLASAFAFCNTGAKEEDRGFFLGFPSYWNVFVFYTDVSFRYLGSGFVLGLLLLLSALSFLPFRFVYPSFAPRWRAAYVFAGFGWFASVVAMLLLYSSTERLPAWLVGISLVYPIGYLVSSFYLYFWDRRKTLREIATTQNK
jgi:phosphatidylcholine synthase